MSGRQNLYELARQLGIQEPERLQGHELGRAITLARARLDLYNKAEWLNISLPDNITSLGTLKQMLHFAIQQRLQGIKEGSKVRCRGNDFVVERIVPQEGTVVYWLRPAGGGRLVPIKEHTLLRELQKEGRA